MAGSDPGRRARQFNVEFRVADATASPYLALAMLVQAGLDGIRLGAIWISRHNPPPLPDQLGRGADAAGGERDGAPNGWERSFSGVPASSSGRRSRAWKIWMKARSAAVMPKSTDQSSIRQPPAVTPAMRVSSCSPPMSRRPSSKSGGRRPLEFRHRGRPRQPRAFRGGWATSGCRRRNCSGISPGTSALWRWRGRLPRRSMRRWWRRIIRAW